MNIWKLCVTSRFRMAALVALIGAAMISRAHGMGEESFGNKPVVAQTDWEPGVLEVVNLESRVYRRWINGNESFFFRGKIDELNRAIEKFAAIQAPVREVILLPDRGETTNFQGDKRIEFDWQVDVPSGIYLHMAKKEKGTGVFYKHARMVIHAAGGGIDIARIEVPAGVTLLAEKDLMARYIEGLGNPDPQVRGQAAYHIGLHPLAGETAGPLAKLLGDDSQYARICAAGALGRLGKRARSALPALKKRLEDPEESVRKTCKEAMEKIEAARDDEKASSGRSAALERIGKLLEARKRGK